MSLTKRIINAFRPAASVTPKPGRVLSPRREDTVRDYPSSGLTPSRLIAVLREADAGDMSSTMQLFEEMEEKDPHLFSVANTRRLTLTGLDWEIVSAADLRSGVDRESADEVAEYCRGVVNALDEFDEVMQHLSLALGRNIALAEIVWALRDGHLEPVGMVPIDFTRIVFDGLDSPRVLTEDEPRDGIELTANKFIIHTPHNVSGHLQRGGLLRVTAMSYLAKNLAMKDWMIYAEVFGMPMRVARYDTSATLEEKRELLSMLETLGSNAAGIFSRAVELEVIDAGRGGSSPPYQKLVDFLNREVSKAWLGQTLTTEVVGQSGSIAASRVHERVRQDILIDDIRKEGRTIRRDLLRPMTVLRFGPNAPVPYFRRKIKQPIDLKQLADILSVAVNDLGLNMSASWVRERLGVPEPAASDMLVRGRSDDR